MRPSSILGAACAASLCLAVAAAGQPDYPPGTFRLTPKVDVELQPVRVAVPAEFASLVPADFTVDLPPGFTAIVYAAFASVQRPRFMAFDADGVLFVANMDDEQIVALPDRDGDGVADEAIVAASGFSRPHSLAFYDGALYVGDRPQILRLHDRDGDLVYEEREVLVDDIPSSGSHSTRTLVIDAERDRMFLGVGWPCDLCRVSDPERGSILEFALDGTGRRIYATGVRNVLGMAVHPLTGQLWGTNNGHDLEGIDAPPEWIDVIRDGGFYGIPLAYGYQVWADFTIANYQQLLPITAADSARVATMERPVALLPAHTAPMGIHFYEGDRFPPRYRHAAFVALHAGHAKLAAIEGYSVLALFSDPDGADARYEDFLGLQTGPDLEDVRGHPMGIVTDAEGRLYVSSDGGYPSDPGYEYILRIDHSPVVAEWATSLPGTVAGGVPFGEDLQVRVTRVAPDAGAPVVTADLSALGGPARAPLADAGDGLWRLRPSFAVTADRGLRTITVTVRQDGAPEADAVRLTHTLAVQSPSPVEDVVLFDEALAPEWDLVHRSFKEDRSIDLTQTDVVYRGAVAASFAVRSSDWDWVISFRPERPFDPVGYTALRFAVHFGPFDRDPADDFNLYVAGKLVDLAAEGYVDVTSKAWQVVEVPLSAFGRPVPLEEITFGGDFSRRLYLDDVRLVGAARPTAVTDGSAVPAGFDLGAAYPNPFNSGTVIPFRLAAAGPVTLIIHNLAGQRVARLVDGALPAGHHTAVWAGTDDAGRTVASGVYLYRLQADTWGQTRKLLLLR